MHYRTAAIANGLPVSRAAIANNGDRMTGYSVIASVVDGAVAAAPPDVTTSLTHSAGLAFLPLGERGTRFGMTVSRLNPGRHVNGVEIDSDPYIMATGGFAFQSALMAFDPGPGIGAYPVSGDRMGPKIGPAMPDAGRDASHEDALSPHTQRPPRLRSSASGNGAS